MAKPVVRCCLFLSPFGWVPNQKKTKMRNNEFRCWYGSYRNGLEVMNYVRWLCYLVSLMYMRAMMYDVKPVMSSEIMIVQREDQPYSCITSPMSIVPTIMPILYDTM